MILAVRAVAPFYKNGFVVGCERTREAVVIDPGDEVDQLLGKSFRRFIVVHFPVLNGRQPGIGQNRNR